LIDDVALYRGEKGFLIRSGGHDECTQWFLVSLY